MLLVCIDICMQYCTGQHWQPASLSAGWLLCCVQLLWAAMRDNHKVRSQADEMRQENAALERELERVQALLRELGVEYNAAVEAAEANQV